MGLSRILKSFSTVSFAWFYLFIMLENVEAKIGEQCGHISTLSVPPSWVLESPHMYLTIIITKYLHNVNGENYSSIDDAK